jgi:hypothetical protein
VERAFLAMIEAVKRSVPLRELEALLRQGNLSAIDQALDVDTRMREAAEGKGVPPGESLFEVLQTVYQAGARAEQGVLATKPVVKAELGVEMSLNLLNPESVAFLQAYTFSLIREVSDSTRLAIRDVVLRAFNEGGHPFEQARTIRNLIGLTNRQGQAVTNFRNMLQRPRCKRHWNERCETGDLIRPCFELSNSRQQSLRLGWTGWYSGTTTAT